MTGPFTVDDFDHLSRLVIDLWGSAVDRDWSVPAGTLEWSCFTTADHTVDCVFSYALFLASRRQDIYPNFTELHALPGARPADLVHGLRAVCTMLTAVVTLAEPGARAIIWSGHTAPAPDFAARGGLELILHAHDVCTGLRVPFDPPRNLCRRLRDHTRDWPVGPTLATTADPWSDLLERSGRARVS
ncbi:MAG: hypothetical protein QOF28_3274 [Actinomycetota bacterium]|jgi:hypothetical protein|nr:hypothetical protein [Actinomycetota bacterium]